MKSENEDELRNFFCFLASDKEFSNVEKIKAEELAFGVDCYLHGLSEVAKRRLKEQIYNKAKDQMISYEDFKNLWITNFDERQDISIKEATNEVFNIISEYLGYDRLIKEITEDHLEQLLVELDIPYYNKNDENENTEEKRKGKLRKTINDMIECIDSDNDGKISKKDLEFIIGEYLSKKNK